MVIKLENQTVYKCAHCGKVSLHLSAMKMHDKFCKKNPDNLSLCTRCTHCKKEYIVHEKNSRCGGWLCFMDNFCGTETCPDGCDGRIHETRMTCGIDGKRMYSAKVANLPENKRMGIMSLCDRPMPTVSHGCPDFAFREPDDGTPEGMPFLTEHRQHKHPR